jgi:hypothetical protein
MLFYFFGRRTASEGRSETMPFVECIYLGRQTIDADLALTEGLKGWTSERLNDVWGLLCPSVQTEKRR